MKPITMYLLIALSLFVAGLPISIIVFVYATSELNKDHNDNQIIAIRIAQVISIILGVVCAVSIFSWRRKREMKCNCGEKSITTFQLLNGEIIDVCYECFKLVEERNNVGPKFCKSNERKTKWKNMN